MEINFEMNPLLVSQYRELDKIKYELNLYLLVEDIGFEDDYLPYVLNQVITVPRQFESRKIY